MNEPPIFKCSKCQATFQSTERDNAPTASDEEVEKCRLALRTKADYLLKTPAITQAEYILKSPKVEALDKLEESVNKLWFAYAAAALRTNVWQIPAELTSHNSYMGYYLACKNCAPKPKKVKEEDA